MSIRARLASLAVLAAAIPAIAVSAPALAASEPPIPPSPTAPDGFVAGDHNVMRWTGDLELWDINRETGALESPTTWINAVVELQCVASDCTLLLSAAQQDTGVDEFQPEYIFSVGRDWAHTNIVDGTFSRAWPREGTLCGDSPVYPLPATTTTAALSATDAVVTTTTEWWVQQCDDGTEDLRGGTVRTFTGTYLSGDPCVLDGGECTPGVDTVATTPEPSSVAAAFDEQAAPATAASQLSSGAPAAASVLTTLPTIQDAPMGVLDVCVAAVVTVILSLLVAFPKKLYASALGALPGRWAEHKEWASGLSHPAGRWWHGVLSRPARPPAARADADEAEEADAASAEEARHGIGSAPWRRAAFGVVAAGVISAFVDPGFGLNPGSVRIAVSLSASFLLNVVVGWSVAIWIARRFTPGLAASYQFKPWTLAVVALTVVFTRVTGMQPGMVFGLVAGVALGAMASKAVEARVAVAQTAYAFALGLVGWGAYSLLAPAWSDTGNLFVRLLIDTLSGLSIAGFAAAPLALLPIAGMGGAKVYEWSQRAWFAMYTVGLLGFFVVLMPMSYSWKEVSFPLAAWLTLYVAYAGVAVILYAALVRPWRSASADEVDAEGVEGDAGEDTGDAAGPEDDRAKEQTR